MNEISKLVLDPNKDIVKQPLMQANKFKEVISTVEEVFKSEETNLDGLRIINPDLGKLVDDVFNRLNNPFFKEATVYSLEQDNSVLIKNLEFPNSSISVCGKDVFAQAGSTNDCGALNEFINNSKLMPNFNYHIDGSALFKTDSLGRITEVRNNYSLPHDETRNSTRDSQTQARVIQDKGGVKGIDDSGHIISNANFGANETINQVPMDPNLNRKGEWKLIENKINQAVSQGKQVFTRDVLSYNESSFRPDTILRELTIDGKKSSIEFSNNINLQEIPQANGSNKEKHTLGQLLSKPMPQDILARIGNPKLKEMAENCNIRNINNIEILKRDGEYDFIPLRVGPEINAPSVPDYKVFLNQKDDTRTALRNGAVTPAMIRKINYEIYREELGKELGVSPKVAGEMIGNDAVCVIHEDKSGKMYMVPQWAHENFKHNGYVSYVVKELNSKD